MKFLSISFYTVVVYFYVRQFSFLLLPPVSRDFTASNLLCPKYRIFFSFHFYYFVDIFSKLQSFPLFFFLLFFSLTCRNVGLFLYFFFPFSVKCCVLSIICVSFYFRYALVRNSTIVICHFILS